MATLEILQYPDPLLRKKSKRLTGVDESVSTLIDDMFETMYRAAGVGLAAPQVNRRVRLIVVDVSKEKNRSLVLLNPQIIHREGTVQQEEGCLSVKGYRDKVSRSEKITVGFRDRNFSKCDLDAEGLLAICIQHEIDHLDGKIFVDYLSSLKQRRVLQKLRKNKAKNKSNLTGEKAGVAV